MSSAAEKRTKDQAMAAHLIRIGYPHGRRFNPPYPGSGGFPVNEPGSAAYRRRVKAQREGKLRRAS